VDQYLTRSNNKEGFWYVFTFSPKGMMNKTPTKNSIDKIRKRLNVGKRYHSGRISNGVAKGVAGSTRDKIPFITTGNMYKISLGHAGSP